MQSPQSEASGAGEQHAQPPAVVQRQQRRQRRQRRRSSFEAPQARRRSLMAGTMLAETYRVAWGPASYGTYGFCGARGALCSISLDTAQGFVFAQREDVPHAMDVVDVHVHESEDDVVPPWDMAVATEETSGPALGPEPSAAPVLRHSLRLRHSNRDRATTDVFKTGYAVL